MLYQRDVGGSDLRQIFGSFDLDRFLHKGGEEGGPAKKASRSSSRRRREHLEQAFEYARTLVQGTHDHREEIDRRIAEQADNWRLERMPVVDRNVLRLAVYELLFQQEIPKLVVVDEAIELAKRFGSEHSSRFVNGLLDGLMKQTPAREESEPRKGGGRSGS